MNSFVKAAGIRALKTMAQVFLSMITLGQGLFDINWLMVLSTMVVAGLYSIVTSIATGLPEVNNDGELIFEHGENGVEVKLNLEELRDGARVVVRAEDILRDKEST